MSNSNQPVYLSYAFFYDNRPSQVKWKKDMDIKYIVLE